MKKKSITLYLLMYAPLWVMAQTYVAPPPLLPNPGNNANNIPIKEPVYAPETNNNINNTATLTQNGRNHLVKKGESLYRIAKLYNVTVDDIKAWNYLQSDLIAAGAKLSIGTPAPYVTNNNVPAQYNQMAERSVPGWQTGLQNHTLLAGESLAAIANYYGLTEARLRSMNNLGPQDLVPAGFVLNVNPCQSNTSLGNSPPPASYEQPNTPGSYTPGNGQDFNSPVPKYTPQNRFANPNTPNSYDQMGNTTNNSGNYTYRREDQYDPNAANSSAIPNAYDYSAQGGIPNNPNTNFGTPGVLIYENGRRVHVVGSNDTLETIADQYQVSAERLRYLNKMGAFDVVRPTQKLLLE
ncbi:MAG: LysM peptidoglycan-binding domain-containing protein [Haliscomenobacter sp.]|uniref:LysM peptidoglycan-binding domain-containing protein n=1 Tax=Haliscomenobacter sp. TaxID=2717303 RepID=UPI0029B88A50|nr:LysM peptidoglycan-binding domain-containing protein [Haliscomenobacter sp.]MDX2066855.1 LysM peptidoglycan-binding domain-containing protein [Haliscomenobacter sp.]